MEKWEIVLFDIWICKLKVKKKRLEPAHLILYLTHQWTAKGQTSLRICAASSEPSLLRHNLRCSDTQSKNLDEESDQNLDL